MKKKISPDSVVAMLTKMLAEYGFAPEPNVSALRKAAPGTLVAWERQPDDNDPLPFPMSKWMWLAPADHETQTVMLYGGYAPDELSLVSVALPLYQEAFVDFYTAAKMNAQYLANHGLFDGVLFVDADGQYVIDAEAELVDGDADGEYSADAELVDGEQVLTDDALPKAIGRFYRIAHEYVDTFKVGGNQKLQKIVGEDIYFLSNGEWWWKIRKITTMPIEDLQNLTKKIQEAKVRALGLPDQIVTIEDIRLFFGYLYFVDKVGFHPDEDFSGYVDSDTRNPTYSIPQARKRDRLMTQAFEVAAAADADIYGIAMEVVRPAGEDDSEW